jgi:cytochrome P450
VPTDDLLGLMVQASEDGTVLSEHELIAHCALLLIAGHETTTNLIGNATLALLRNPAELARLRIQPDLAASAVEEFLRYDGAVAGTARRAGPDGDADRHDSAAGPISPDGARGQRTEPAQ